jgi:hypothetical protein
VKKVVPLMQAILHDDSAVVEDAIKVAREDARRAFRADVVADLGQRPELNIPLDADAAAASAMKAEHILDSKIYTLKEKRKVESGKAAVMAINMIVESISPSTLARARTLAGWSAAINSNDAVGVLALARSAVDLDLGAKLLAGHAALSYFVNLKAGPDQTLEEYYRVFVAAQTECVRLGIVLQSDTYTAYHFIGGLADGYETFKRISASREMPYPTLQSAVTAARNWGAAAKVEPVYQKQEETVVYVGQTSYNDAEWASLTPAQKNIIRQKRRTNAKKRKAEATSRKVATASEKGTTAPDKPALAQGKAAAQATKAVVLASVTTAEEFDSSEDDD